MGRRRPAEAVLLDKPTRQATNVNVIYIHIGSSMSIAARLDELGRPAWIVLMILAFALYWPVGLVILAYLLWSRRMGCWNHGHVGRWHRGGEAWQDWPGAWGRGGGRSSGNRAFDEYRAETLRRLEEEQREFKDFLD